MPVRKKSGNGLFYNDDDDDADTSDVDVEDDTDSDGIVLPTTRTSSSLLASSGSFAEMTLRLQNHGGIICTPKTDGSSCIRRPRPSGSILKKTSKFTTS